MARTILADRQGFPASGDLTGLGLRMRRPREEHRIAEAFLPPGRQSAQLGTTLGLDGEQRNQPQRRRSASLPRPPRDRAKRCAYRAIRRGRPRRSHLHRHGHPRLIRCIGSPTEVLQHGLRGSSPQRRESTELDNHDEHLQSHKPHRPAHGPDCKPAQRPPPRPGPMHLSHRWSARRVGGTSNRCCRRRPPSAS